MVAMRNPHRGGEQLPLLVPETGWLPPAELPDLVGRGVTHLALDTETCDHRLSRDQGPGWPFRDGHVCGVSAAWREGGAIRSLYAPLRHPDTACVDTGRMQNWLQHHLQAGIVPVFQNSHYDIGWMSVLGAREDWYRGGVEDTLCQAFMLEENHLQYDLDSICRRLGVPGKDETLLREALVAHGFPNAGREAKKYIHRLPARFVGPYAEADAAQTLEAWERMRPMLEAQRVQDAYRLEMELVPCVHRMQAEGVRVNVARAEQRAAALRAKRDEVLAELGRRLGETVAMDNIARGDWLPRRFDAQGIPYPRTAPTSRFPVDIDENGDPMPGTGGQPSFTTGPGGWMHKHPHWLPRLVVAAEKLHKAAKDYLEADIANAAHAGRLHANINQFRTEDNQGTRTHRFSYSNPPLQQMPARDEDIAEAVRGCFEPEEGEEWVCCDYPQQEYRLIVHFAEILGLPKASAAGDRYRGDPETDYHNMVVEMTGLSRGDAKNANFAKAYGAGAGKFAVMINKSREEAAAIMEQYDRELPFVSVLARIAQEAAERRGYIRLIDGARLHYEQWEPSWRDWRREQDYLRAGGKMGVTPCGLEEAKRRAAAPDHPWHRKRLRRAFTRKAGNGLIQGSAARMTKKAMVLAHREGIRLRLQVHDELNASVGSRAEGERLAEIMTHAVRLTVPIVVKAEFGPSWGAVE